VTVTASEEQREGKEVLSDPVPESLRRQVRARASSVTPGEGSSPGVVTDSIRRTWQVATLAARFGAGMANKPGSLYLAQPPSFAQARDRHHECAGHFGSPLLKLLRLAWGYVHLLTVKPVLNYAEVATSSPAWFFANVAIGVVIWFFI